MNFVINKTIEEISDQISASINHSLESGKKVLWFVSGGSVISIEVLVAQKINKDISSNLTVSLADERYGLVNHVDSNWFNLKKLGFDSFNFNAVTFLSGESFSDTGERINLELKDVIKNSDYIIGMFGIGEDGHTAGILPHSDATESKELVCTYKTPKYDRITITKNVIEMLDEAFVYSVGENKREAIKKLQKEISAEEEPAQLLKEVPLLTIFTDYIKS